MTERYIQAIASAGLKSTRFETPGCPPRAKSVPAPWEIRDKSADLDKIEVFFFALEYQKQTCSGFS
ncbi:hypothetical protein A1356_19805 [Methylomonas koyamae]|uniref:Uncharacterized protein n=1 Tax=Methylomonas koyamae TaxID=702114 RepID=A0AA91D8U7_9GAMM|nr:hypothetical protein A1356_19805 [Methylomonas koyamae]